MKYAFIIVLKLQFMLSRMVQLVILVLCNIIIEHYIDLSTEIKQILKSVFLPTADLDPEIKQYNIILCGYSLRDIDLSRIIISNINKSIENKIYTKIFIIDKNPMQIINSVLTNCLEDFKFKQNYVEIDPEEKNKRIEDYIEV
ncbi:MAG: hypothetical protein IPM91_14775 [Bacteroidetes bacterium]|nr:hypothetical protein [Bacteroidota bacterium]